MNTEQGRTHRGFTLIEVMIVVVVLGILAGVAVPRYRASMARARYGEAMQMVSAIAKAQAIYAYEHGALTTDLSKLDISIPASSSVAGGSYYGWTTVTNGVGFGLGFDPSQSPTNVSTDHKLGIDMTFIGGVPQITKYWWREDAPGKIGGGDFHWSATGWDGVK